MTGHFMVFSVLANLLIFLSYQAGKVKSYYQVYTTRTGVLMFPNYTSNYGDNMNCTWEICPNYGGRVVLNVNQFQLETSSSCYNDILMIYDGKVHENRILLNKRSGNISMKHETVISSLDRMVVVFRKDPKSTYKGFNITWDTCGGTFTDEEYRITSPKYYYQVTTKNPHCSFHLETSKFSSVQINLSETKLGNYTGECLIQVFDSDDMLLGKICNDTDPRIYISNTNKTTVMFKLMNQCRVILKAFFRKYETPVSENNNIYRENTSVPLITGIIVAVLAGIAGTTVVVTIYCRKRETPEVKREKITTNIIYANTLEVEVQFQREQQDTSDQMKFEQQKFHLRPSATSSLQETGYIGADNLYAGTNEGFYDVLHERRQKVVPEMEDNLYDVSVKDNNLYDTTRRYTSPAFQSADEMYDSVNRCHGNDNIYDEAGIS